MKMKCFLSTININGIDLCLATIKVYLYHHLIAYISLKYLKALKSVLYIERLGISQQIPFNKNMII